MTYQLTKLAADGSDLPADATGHKAVRLDHGLLRQPIIWTAKRSPTAMTWQEAQQWVDTLDTYGWRWRLPTAEEAFLLCDWRLASFLPVDPVYFPDCDGEWIWTATEDIVPPAGCAWNVNLHNGRSIRAHQDYRSHVRAVRAGQQK